MTFRAFILSILASFVAGLFFYDPIKGSISALWYTLTSRGIRQIEGYWISEYWYLATAGEKIITRSGIKLKQYGRYVEGVSHDDPNHEYRIKGEIRDNYFTGTWRNTHKRQSAHGAFQ